MIKVVIKRTNDEVTYILIKGHAYSGVSGHDLVCAGVSAVAIGALNSLSEDALAFKTKVSDGLVEITPLYRPNEHDKIVLEVLITSLKTIEESYSQFLKIREERKQV